MAALCPGPLQSLLLGYKKNICQLDLITSAQDAWHKSTNLTYFNPLIVLQMCPWSINMVVWFWRSRCPPGMRSVFSSWGRCWWMLETWSQTCRKRTQEPLPPFSPKVGHHNCWLSMYRTGHIPPDHSFLLLCGRAGWWKWKLKNSLD